MAEKTLSLYQKLHKIQSVVMGLGKDKESHAYNYTSGNKVLSHIKPLMVELGLLLKQEILSIDNTRQDYVIPAKKGKWGESPEKLKNEILSKVMMRFTWIDIDSGEKDENSFGANGQNDWEKGLGSALTYGERYFLLKYFHIATDEDDIDNPDRKPVDDKEVVVPKGDSSKATAPGLEALHEKHEKWDTVIGAIKAGKVDMKYVESKFSMSSDVRKKIEESIPKK